MGYRVKYNLDLHFYQLSTTSSFAKQKQVYHKVEQYPNKVAHKTECKAFMLLQFGIQKYSGTLCSQEQNKYYALKLKKKTLEKLSV